MTLSRRGFIGAAVGVGVAGTAATAFGTRMMRRLPDVVEMSVQVRGLPAGLEGFRLVALGDLHAGPYFDRSRYEDIVAQVDLLDADLVVLLGDMIDGASSEADIRDFSAAFAQLSARHGVLAVPGNHEHVAGIDRAMDAIRSTGALALVDAHHVVKSRGDQLVFLGTDDPGGAGFDPPQDEAVERVWRGVPPNRACILLSHRPRAFEAAQRLGIPLTLSGHTHGGQIGLPWADVSFVRFLTPYVRGWYATGPSRLYVTSGVGASGIPLRFGIPPSLAVLTLVRELDHRESA